MALHVSKSSNLHNASISISGHPYCYPNVCKRLRDSWRLGILANISGLRKAGYGGQALMSSSDAIALHRTTMAWVRQSTMLLSFRCTQQSHASRHSRTQRKEVPRIRSIDKLDRSNCKYVRTCSSIYVQVDYGGSHKSDFGAFRAATHGCDFKSVSNGPSSMMLISPIGRCG